MKLLNIFNRQQKAITPLLIALLICSCSSDKSKKDPLKKKSSPINVESPVELTSPDTSEEKQKIPNTIEASSGIAKSTVMLTASQTNLRQNDYKHFELALFDIKFTIVPTGKTDAIEAWLYNEKPITDLDFTHTIPIHLTPLDTRQHLLIDTLELPAGKITSITTYFSGKTSHIKIPNKNTYLIDPVFFNYEVASGRTPKIRLNAIEQKTTTDISIAADNFHIINLTIDQSMSAGLDPHFYPADAENGLNEQHYIQFIPTTRINTITATKNLELVIAGIKTISLNDDLKINTVSFSVDTDNVSINIDNTPTEDLSSITDKTPLYIKGTFEPLATPSFAIDTIDVFTTEKQFKTYMDATSNQNKQNAIDKDTVIFHIRDSFNAPNKDILNITDADAMKSDTMVTFNLPQTDNDEGNKIGWPCESILKFFDSSKMPEDCQQSLVTHLQLPLTKEINGEFVLVETRRGEFEKNTDADNTSLSDQDSSKVNTTDTPQTNNDTDDTDKTSIDNNNQEAANITNFPTLVLAPDIQHHFTNSSDFYAMLKTKLLDENYRLGVLEAEGSYNNNQFEVSNTMKVIVLAPQPLLDSQTDGWLEEVEEAILEKESTSSSLSTGAIAGIAIGGGIAAIGLIASAILLRKKIGQNSGLTVNQKSGEKYIVDQGADTMEDLTEFSDGKTADLQGNTLLLDGATVGETSDYGTTLEDDTKLIDAGIETDKVTELRENVVEINDDVLEGRQEGSEIDANKVSKDIGLRTGESLTSSPDKINTTIEFERKRYKNLMETARKNFDPQKAFDINNKNYPSNYNRPRTSIKK